uniref:Uncharacterized protein n=1 Tax=Siphoviridae sp. ctLqe90 TaxID=2825456 RepID=A0A8S5Q1V1_9CAUD|nr:MAG TPA: hypothetical protein [Siphoviridae sp. ctLqe90]
MKKIISLDNKHYFKLFLQLILNLFISYRINKFIFILNCT